MDGDDPAFEELVEREYRPLVRALTLFCGDALTAEELTQDALARAYQRWATVARMARPGAWLRTVAFNLARSRFRRRAAERRAYARHGPDARTSHQAESADVLTVREAVVALPPRQRQVLIHRYFLGYSVAETAEVVGISDGAVKAATHKAIAALRREVDVPNEEREGSRHV